MTPQYLWKLLLLTSSYLTSYFSPLSSNLCNSPPIRAVNLGGWLLIEGSIKPSLFDGIPNKDLLDGTHLHFKSVKFGKYLCAENGGGTIIVANRTTASLGWESFRLWRINETTFHLRVFNREFVGLDNQGDGVRLVAFSDKPGRTETFQIVRKADDLNRVRIKASNGFFLQVKNEELVTTDFEGESGWGDDDPSVFIMAIAKTMQGDFQLTNGYGSEKATQVLREHWDTFIVEEDFKFLSENGLNAMRIPVGWWIASDPMPPKPFIGGSLQALDKAFLWAKKYGLKIIIDLHATPGAQNDFDNSGTRDGFHEWGETDDSIQETVAIVDFLTARYTNNPSFAAIGLINEPRYPGVSLERLIKYYKAGYVAVRKHSSTAYVMMSPRVGPANSMEIFPLLSQLQGSVLDLHLYNLFEHTFKNMTAQQNIDYVYNKQSQKLRPFTSNGLLLTFIGEWVDEWEVEGATKEDYQRFAKAQLEVYGHATVGWAYWSLKHVQNHWSLEWMIKNNYVKL